MSISVNAELLHPPIKGGLRGVFLALEVIILSVGFTTPYPPFLRGNCSPLKY